MLFFFLKCVNPYLPPKPQQPHTHELSCPWVLGMVWHRPVCPLILTSYILLNLRHVVSKGCFHLLIEFVACLYVEFSFVSPCNFVPVCRVGLSAGRRVGRSACRSVCRTVDSFGRDTKYQLPSNISILLMSRATTLAIPLIKKPL